MIINQLEPIKAQTINDDGKTYVIRSVDELAQLPSYSEMSDIEVEKLMRFRADTAAKQRENEVLAQMQQAFSQAIQTSLDTMARNRREEFNRLVNNPPTFTTVNNASLGTPVTEEVSGVHEQKEQA